MVSEAEKKRIDTWLDKHLKELAQPEDGSTARCPWAYSSKGPIIHTDQYMDIMKHMINFPYDDGVHGLLIVLHGVQNRNEGQDLIGLCKTKIGSSSLSSTQTRANISSPDTSLRML